MKNKKRILLFIDWFKPGYKAGGPITSCANMIALLKDDFHFQVITSDRDYMQEHSYPDIHSNEWIPYSENCEVYYLSKENENQAFMKSLVNSLNFEYCYLNGMFSKVYSIWPLSFVKKEKIILAPRGMLRPSALAIKGFKKKAYLTIARLSGKYKNVVFQGTTSEEANDIRKQNLSQFVRVASNCPKLIDKPKAIKKIEGNLEIVFAGRIAKEKNLLFALETLKKTDLKGINFRVIGQKYDQDYFQECRILSESLKNVKVEFLGALEPTKFKRELQKAHLMFLPTLGENYGHVIYESLVNGTPVLISDQTPWLDLDKSAAGFELDLKNMALFAEKIKSFLLMGDSDYQKYFDGAIEYASQRIDFESIRTEYIRLFE